MRTTVRLAALCLAIITSACSGEGGFSGENGKAASSQTKKAEKPKKASDTTTSNDAGNSADVLDVGKSATSAEIPSTNQAADNSQAPDTAITKGSFTAWAEPPNPKPLQSYWIHVEVTLPSNVANYTATDLSGRLVGSDGYTRGVGRDSRGATEGIPDWQKVGVDLADKFQLSPGIATISIFVPGAAELVRDTIQIHSDLLRENQSLEIVFK